MPLHVVAGPAARVSGLDFLWPEPVGPDIVCRSWSVLLGRVVAVEVSVKSCNTFSPVLGAPNAC